MRRTGHGSPEYGRKNFAKKIGNAVGESEAILRLCPTTHKYSFATEVRARKFVEEGQRTGGPFFTSKRVYRCEYCDYWHMTSLAINESPHALFERHAHFRVVLSVLMDPDVIMFACVNPKRVVLDESPMCIPWYWTDSLRSRGLVTASSCTPDGYRQISITPLGRRVIARVGRVDQATIDRVVAESTNGYLECSDL